MAGRHISPKLISNTKPTVLSMKYKTGEAIKQGTLCLLDANGELTVCGLDPQVVDAVALEAAATKPGWDAANSPIVVTGRVQEVSAVSTVGDADTIFSMRGVNGGTDPVTPAQTNLDEAYGAIMDADGVWVLDLADAVNTTFIVVDIDIPNKIFFCKFKPAVVGL